MYCFCSLTPVYCFCSCYSSSGGENCLTLPIVPVSVSLKGETISTLLFCHCSFEGRNCLNLTVPLLRYCSFGGRNRLNPTVPVTVALLILNGRIVSPCAVSRYCSFGGEKLSQPYCSRYCFFTVPEGENCLTLYCFPLLFLKGRIVSPCVVSYCLSVRVLPRGRVRARPNFRFIRR